MWVLHQAWKARAAVLSFVDASRAQRALGPVPLVAAGAVASLRMRVVESVERPDRQAWLGAVHTNIAEHTTREAYRTADA